MCHVCHPMQTIRTVLCDEQHQSSVLCDSITEAVCLFSVVLDCMTNHMQSQARGGFMAALYILYLFSTCLKIYVVVHLPKCFSSPRLPGIPVCDILKSTAPLGIGVDCVQTRNM